MLQENDRVYVVWDDVGGGCLGDYKYRGEAVEMLPYELNEDTKITDTRNIRTDEDGQKYFEHKIEVYHKSTGEVERYWIECCKVVNGEVVPVTYKEEFYE